MKKIFTGTFYPLTVGETLSGYDHYNYKLPLVDYFDIKTFCYNSEGKFSKIGYRIENDKRIQIIRFNESMDDMLHISQLFKLWKPDVCNFHGGNSGQKGTARRIINDYKGQGIKFGLEYGGGYDKNTMMQHYYNEDADYVILNHDMWRTFFPDNYQSKIHITPKQQSVDTNFFKPLDVEKKYDLLFVGRNENKGAEEIYEMFKDKSHIKVLFKGNGYPEHWKSDNIFIEPAEYNHKKIVEVYNSAKVFVMGRPSVMENPFALHMRVIAEAIACGLPVVAFKDNFVGSNLLYHRKNALLVDTPQEFVGNVASLLGDSFFYRDYSEESREVAIDCDISQFMQFYKDLWDNI